MTKIQWVEESKGHIKIKMELKVHLFILIAMLPAAHERDPHFQSSSILFLFL